MHELVAEDVQQRYLLTYSPANQTADGAWRRITPDDATRRTASARAPATSRRSRRRSGRRSSSR